MLVYCLVVAIFLVVNHLSVSSASVTLDLVFYDSASENSLVCNDGTPGGYYFRPAVGEEAQDKWIFYLQGGGWCWNETSCEHRINQNGDGHLVSSSKWSTSKTYNSGIFKMSETPWEHANLVYVPYCSSDAHMGDTEVDIPNFGVQQFRGRRLAREAVSQLVGMKENQRIIFGGTSAGGRGSMVLVDFIHELVHKSSAVYGLHDSGAYQDIAPFDPGYYPFGKQCHNAYQMYTPPISVECNAIYGEDSLYKCVCGEYMLPNVMTPSQVIIHQYDSYQLSQNIGHAPKDWTYDECMYAEDPYRLGMRITVDAIEQNVKHVVFAPACYLHGLMTQKVFQNIKVDGISAQDQLISWLEDGERRRAVSYCEGVNCQPSCPEIEIGPQSWCIDKN